MAVAAIDVGDFLVVVLPTLGALVGSYFGVVWRARSEADRELRALADEGAASLARADQTRGGAYVAFAAEGSRTSPEVARQ